MKKEGSEKQEKKKEISKEEYERARDGKLKYLQDRGEPAFLDDKGEIVMGVDILEQKNNLEKIREIIKRNYNGLIGIQKYYCDLKEEDYLINALWIIGTYLHRNFPTYPYLFFNALKGSGKTRLLKLIASLSRNGVATAGMSEAVLFRTAKDSTICIDEFERASSKDKQALRELLNIGYKKGLDVRRIKKVNTAWGEERQVEKFDMFVPICMANIYGMEDVLSDRCITLILEKSENKRVTRKMENYDSNPIIQELRKEFSVVVSQNVESVAESIVNDWNGFIHDTYTLTTQTTQTTQTTPFIEKAKSLGYDLLFEKIEKSKLNGRNLELFFPLLMIAWLHSPELLEKTIGIAENISKSKDMETIMENKDVALMDFIANYLPKNKEWITLNEVRDKFREFLDSGEQEDKWVNSNWLGRALKRLNLYTNKRRVSKGREVILDFKKAQEKIRIYKSEAQNREADSKDIFVKAKESENLLNSGSEGLEVESERVEDEKG